MTIASKWTIPLVVTALSVGLLCLSSVGAGKAPDANPAAVKPAPTKPSEVTDPGPFLGEYEGTFKSANGAEAKAAAKVFGIPGGLYKVVLICPPDKDMDASARRELQGKPELDGLAISGKAGDAEWTGSIEKQQLLVEAKGEKGGKFDLKFMVRKSPTEGEKPPKDAIVLLAFEEGKAPSLDAWDNKTWVAEADGCMHKGKGDTKTVQKFGGIKLHAEFMCPYMPGAGGQGRGNSGVYFQDRYEIQVLDSFGLISKNNDCGAFYSGAAPLTNACLPPLRWQTYDITFRVPRMVEGKVKPGSFTVLHNGVKILDNQEIAGKPTTAAGATGIAPTGPLKLQDHGNTVKYRNIWLVELKDEGK